MEKISRRFNLAIVFMNVRRIKRGYYKIDLELIVDKPTTGLEIPKLAEKFVDVLGNLSYIGVGVNLRGYIDFGADHREASHARCTVRGTTFRIAVAHCPGPHMAERRRICYQRAR
jgi:hypothetical protein